MLTSEQCRAARAILNWTQQHLAQIAGVSKTSINSFEQGRHDLRAANLKIIQDKFEGAGLLFQDEYSIRRKEHYVEILTGESGLQKLWDHIFSTLKDKGGEVLITNVDEKKGLDLVGPVLTDHLARLKKHKISERLLSCEGDDFFLAPQECYRWLSKDVFASAMTSYVYQGKVALQLWGGSLITLIHSEAAYRAEKERFEHLWKHAQIPPKKADKKPRK